MKVANWVKSGTVFALFLTLGQISTYLVSLVAASSLTIENFGLFSSLIAVLSVLTTFGIGLQIAVSSVGNSSPFSVSERSSWRYVDLVTAIQILLVASLTPLVSYYLRAPVFVVLLFLASSIPMISSSGMFGIALGYKSVAMQTFSIFTPVFTRSVFLIFGLLLFEASLQMIGVLGLIGSIVGVVCVRKILTRHGLKRNDPNQYSILYPIHLKATVSVFALYLLLTTDMLTARWLLEEADAGLYAAGNLVTKIGFFLPSSIGLLASPILAGKRSKKTKNVVYSLTITTGLLYAVFVSLFGKQVLSLLNDNFTHSPTELFLFAWSGVAISLIQLAVYENALSDSYFQPAVTTIFALAVPMFALILGISQPVSLIKVSCVCVTLCAFSLFMFLRIQEKSEVETNTVM